MKSGRKGEKKKTKVVCLGSIINWKLLQILCCCSLNTSSDLPITIYYHHQTQTIPSKMAVQSDSTLIWLMRRKKCFSSLHLGIVMKRQPLVKHQQSIDVKLPTLVFTLPYANWFCVNFASKQNESYIMKMVWLQKTFYARKWLLVKLRKKKWRSSNQYIRWKLLVVGLKIKSGQLKCVAISMISIDSMNIGEKPQMKSRPKCFI